MNKPSPTRDEIIIVRKIGTNSLKKDSGSSVNGSEPEWFIDSDIMLKMKLKYRVIPTINPIRGMKEAIPKNILEFFDTPQIYTNSSILCSDKS
ncbi:MAG: hypothetical protein COA58_12175 [Bacteroidetes bacterium]|nr:MAG: hypothetical protein COA58_12175 [Bacteroidota bacterium]